MQRCILAVGHLRQVIMRGISRCLCRHGTGVQRRGSTLLGTGGGIDRRLGICRVMKFLSSMAILFFSGSAVTGIPGVISHDGSFTLIRRFDR